jgi:hypothetical protein
MIANPVTSIALAAMLVAAASCSPSGSAKQDASSAAAARSRLASDRVANQVRRKADMTDAGTRAREKAARDIALSDARAARSAARH